MVIGRSPVELDRYIKLRGSLNVVVRFIAEAKRNEYIILPQTRADRKQTPILYDNTYSLLWKVLETHKLLRTNDCFKYTFHM